MKIKSLLIIIFFAQFINLGLDAQAPERKGWWKFDDPGDLLKAEIGDPLTLVGIQQSVDGPAEGNKATQLTTGNYLIMTHNISPNGGGTTVNEYSLQIDFLIPEGGIWHAFIQTDPTNDGDADLFTNSTNSLGVAATGYTAKGISANNWYRMIVTVKNDEFFRIYIDGQLWLDAAGQGLDDRFGLLSTLLIFADNDGEDGTINCSELGIWDVALDADQVLALGGATGIRVPVRTKLGIWKFDDPADLVKAQTGNPLKLTGTMQSVDGPEAGDKAVEIGPGSYLKMANGILPNGGGGLVNEYSLLIDFMIPEGNTWHAFFQTDPTNSSDADLFTNLSNAIGTSATTYTSNTIEANKWYRMVISVKNGEFFNIYVNADLWLEGTGQDIDGRWALADTLLLFADNDGDDGTIICSEICIWEVALDEYEVADLGNDPTNQIPERKGWWKFEDFQNIGMATIGEDLIVNGTITSINGPDNQNFAVQVGVGSYFDMVHGILGNGDGYMVNEYALQIDFMIPEGGVWHTFFQTDPTNSSDADLFTNTSNSIGTWATTYTANSIEPNTWYRMVITVKNGYFFKIFIDGEIWLNGAGQAVDERYALADNLLLFADDDGEDGLIYCSEVGIWDMVLTEEQVSKLGTAYGSSVGTGPIHSYESDGLSQNYPNPFYGNTEFIYRVSETVDVNFRLFDITGKMIRIINEGLKPAGTYSFVLNSGDLNSGIYFIRMNAGNLTSTRKIIVR